jgi:hypothetical protein
MPIPTIEHVQPGDLIKSEFINALISALETLETRVRSLEGRTVGGLPRLLSRTPAGDVEVDSPLTLVGQNFSMPASLNEVTLAGFPINQFTASDDTHLTFTVPDVFGGLPRTVPINVRSQVGLSLDQLEVRLLPRRRAGATSDPRVVLTIDPIPTFIPGTSTPNNVSNAFIGGENGVEVRFSFGGQIPINVHVTSDSSAAGTYLYSASIEDPAGLWSGGGVSPADSSQAASSDRKLAVNIQNTESPLSGSTAVKFMVVRAVHRTSAGIEDFTSFLRFPIQGFGA